MELEAQRNSNFVLYCASQYPKVEITDVEVRPATGDLFWIEVTVKNDRAYPTSSDRAVMLKRAVQDVITAAGSSNTTIIDIPRGGVTLDPLNRAAQADAIGKQGTEFRLKARDSKTFSILVKMEGTQGWVEFTVKSKTGGTAVKRIDLKTS
jgi:hypothetical protein